MRARVAHDVAQHEGHAGELNAEQLEPLPLSPTLACDAHHAVRLASMLVPITTSTSSPARLKTRVGGSTSPRAFRVGKFPRQPRGPHRETTTRARRFAVGSRKYLSPEPLVQNPNWVKSELASGHQVLPYGYGRNNPITNADPTGNNPLVWRGILVTGEVVAAVLSVAYWCLINQQACQEALRRFRDTIGRPLTGPLPQDRPRPIPVPKPVCMDKAKPEECSKLPEYNTEVLVEAALRCTAANWLTCLKGLDITRDYCALLLACGETNSITYEMWCR